MGAATDVQTVRRIIRGGAWPLAKVELFTVNIINSMVESQTESHVFRRMS